jgi:hypothetical protein
MTQKSMMPEGHLLKRAFTKKIEGMYEGGSDEEDKKEENIPSSKS